MKQNFLKKTNDFIWIIWSWLTSLNAEWGIILKASNPETGNINFVLDWMEWEMRIKTISEAGANATRLMPWGFWKLDRDNPKIPDEERFTPYYYDPIKKKWDLTKFNQYYFDILKEMFAKAQDPKYKITIHFCLFDNCQFHFRDGTKTPWNKNIQGVKTFYNQWKLAKLWVDKCLLEFKDFDIFYSLGNELTAEGVSTEVAVDFCTELRQHLLSNDINPENMDYGFMISNIIYDPNEKVKSNFKPKRRTFAAEAGKKWTFKKYYGTKTIIDKKTGKPRETLSDKGRKIRKNIMRVCHSIGEHDPMFPHLGLNVPAILDWFYDAPHDSRWILSTDGTRVITGISCDQDLLNNKVRPGAKVWRNIVNKILSNKYVKWGSIGIEHLPTKKTSLDCQETILRAISDEYKKKLGKYPKNWKLPGDKKPEPVIEIDPVIDPIIELEIKENKKMAKKSDKGKIYNLFVEWYGGESYVIKFSPMIIMILVFALIGAKIFPTGGLFAFKLSNGFWWLIMLGFAFEPVKKWFLKLSKK